MRLTVEESKILLIKGASKVRLGRLVGAGIGLVILLVVFLVPFAAIPGYFQKGQTLFAAFSGALGKVSHVQSGNSMADAAAILVLAVAGLIITIAGIVGIFPLGAGVLGVVGMGMLTAGPYFTGQITSYTAASFDLGFYLLWIASIAALVMAFVGRQVPLLKRNMAVQSKEAGGTSK